VPNAPPSHWRVLPEIHVKRTLFVKDQIHAHLVTVAKWRDGAIAEECIWI
jgi:hypothetical protein